MKTNYITVNHNTMLTPYDMKLKLHEVKIIDDYICSNSYTDMNTDIFCDVVYKTLPKWRSEQLVSISHNADIDRVYEQYINFYIDKT